MKKSINQFISFNSFLSTSTNRKQALEFLNLSKSDNTMENILFEIVADPNIGEIKSFADISELSYFPGEQEILFTIGSIFHLRKITFNIIEQYWAVEMTLASNDDNELKEVLDYLKQKIGNKKANLRTLANILIDMKKYKLAQEYIERMLKQLPSDDHLHIDLYEDLIRNALQMGDTKKSKEWSQKLNQFIQQNPSASLIKSKLNLDNLLQINKNDLEFYEEIGSGGFGTVRRANWISNRRLVAVKVLNFTQLNKDSEKIFLNELSLLNRIRHPNIITFYGTCIQKEYYALIMEYMSLGSLYQLIHENKITLSRSHQLSIALQATQGISYLHHCQPPILHRDIKSLNLLLENHQSEYIVKVCDFGMAKIRNQTTSYTKERTHVALTLSWTAPEFLRLEPYTFKSDVYSLGIVFWELVTHQIPYNGHPDNVVRAYVLAGDRLPIPSQTPSDFRMIIERCWAHEPDDRPTCIDILQMLEECINNQDNEFSSLPSSPSSSSTENLQKNQNLLFTITNKTGPKTSVPDESKMEINCPSVNIDEVESQMKNLMAQIDRLREYTIPHYFFILPAKNYDLARIDNDEDLFNLHFKLYFLCECSNNPKELHITQHDGYSIKKFKEFIAKYGQYLQKTLNLVKVLVSIQRQTSKHLNNINHRIVFLQKFLDKPEIQRMYTDFSLTGSNRSKSDEVRITDLQELRNYLYHINSTSSSDNLNRIITFDKHIRWICKKDYDIISYNQTANEFIKQIGSISGKFHEENRQIKLSEIKLRSAKVNLITDILTKGSIVSQIVFDNCTIYDGYFYSLFDTIINQPSIHSFEIINLNILNFFGYTTYIFNHLKVTFLNYSLRVKFNESFQEANKILFLRVLMFNKIHRTLEISADDFLNCERQLQECLNANTVISELIVNHANNIDILNAILTLKTNQIRQLKLINSLLSPSVRNHFCQLLKANETLVELNLLDSTDFYNTDFLEELFRILKQHKSIKRISLHISLVEKSHRNETLLINLLENHKFINHLCLSKSTISSQFIRILINAVQVHHSLTHLEFYQCILNENDIKQLKTLENKGYLFSLVISQQLRHISDRMHDQRTWSYFPLKSNLKWIPNAETIFSDFRIITDSSKLCEPHGIFVDNQRQAIYVADYQNHRIVKWELDENIGEIVAGGNEQGNRIDQLNKPTDVIVDQNNKSLIICDRWNKRVVQWSLENQQDKQIIIENIGCFGLMMTGNGDLFVSDVEKHEVKRWRKGEKGGIIVAGGNGEGKQLNQLNKPTFIFVDQEETVYVSDSWNHRVMKWIEGAKEGVVVAGGQGKGKGLNQLDHPQGLIVNEIGEVYVVDHGNDRIMCWSSGSKEGCVVVGGHGRGRESNQFNYPKGLSFDDKNNLYVVDEWNNRIQRFKVDKN